MKRNRETEQDYRQYFALVLQGSFEEFQKLKEHIVSTTGLSIKYMKSSRFYLLIQPAPRLVNPTMPSPDLNRVQQ